MKTNILFIEARKKGSAFQEPADFEKNARGILNMLPKSFLLAYTIQYKYMAEKLKDFFERNGKEVSGFMQVLGCTKLNAKERSILLVGSGRFHALQLALQGKSVFVYENEAIRKITEPEIKKFLLKRKISLSKFISSESIGIIASSKPGQGSLGRALDIKRALEKQGKEAFIFLADNINLGELENFRIDFWVNTACPGIALDTAENPNVANYGEIIL